MTVTKPPPQPSSLSMSSCTEPPKMVCKSCLAGPRQGRAEQVSKSKNKFLATTYKPFLGPLYNTALAVKLNNYTASHPNLHSKRRRPDWPTK